ncbi:MAG: hypothetical protein KAT00_07345 [Planctomycetes bacterium]|nr:hypothetical protein [Planctomycetota bacterium]
MGPARIGLGLFHIEALSTGGISTGRTLWDKVKDGLPELPQGKTCFAPKSCRGRPADVLIATPVLSFLKSIYKHIRPEHLDGSTDSLG